MKWQEVLALLAPVILAGGGLGAYVSFRKLPAERDLIVVQAAKEVVVVQQGAYKELRDQYEELRKEMESMEARFSQRLDQAEQARHSAETALAESHRARELVQAEYDEEKARNAELTARIEALEAEVAELREVNRNRPPGS